MTDPVDDRPGPALSGSDLPRPDLPRPDLFTAPAGFAPRSAWKRDCTACGACCTAPDISALSKPLGLKCVNLGPETGSGCLCRVYQSRPAVCRSYQPDWVCGEVAPLPTLGARAARFLEIYGLGPGAGGV